MNEYMRMADRMYDLDNQFEQLKMKNEELEKENAELKGKLNIRSCQNCKHNNKSCPNDGSCKNYSKWKGYENPQLTKAKEIIKSLIALHYNPVVTKDDLKKQDKILEQAEQFLKELEK